MQCSLGVHYEAFLALARVIVTQQVLAEHLEAAAKQLAELLAQEYKDMATLYKVIQDRPQEFVRFVLEASGLALMKAFPWKDRALAVLAGTGVSDTDIQGAVRDAVAAHPGSTDGSLLFNTAAGRIRSDQKVDWADDLVGARIVDAYLAATPGKKLTVSEIRKMDEQAFSNLVQQVTATVGPSVTAILNEAYRRVRASWLPSLEQQIEQLGSQLATLTQQLDAMKQEVAAMKQRTDPLPLALGIVALVLAAGATLLALRKRRQQER